MYFFLFQNFLKYQIWFIFQLLYNRFSKDLFVQVICFITRILASKYCISLGFVSSDRARNLILKLVCCLRGFNVKLDISVAKLPIPKKIRNTFEFQSKLPDSRKIKILPNPINSRKFPKISRKKYLFCQEGKRTVKLFSFYK